MFNLPLSYKISTLNNWFKKIIKFCRTEFGCVWDEVLQKQKLLQYITAYKVSHIYVNPHFLL